MTKYSTLFSGKYDMVPKDLEDVSIFSRLRRPLKLGKIDFRGENILLLLTLIAIVCGSVIGVVLQPSIAANPSATPMQNGYIKFPGDIFLRVLKLLAVPLISSNISSAASSKGNATRWLSAMSLFYYIATSLLAACIGAILAVSIKPGVYLHVPSNQTVSPDAARLHAISSIMDLVKNIVPDNIVSAAFQSDVSMVKSMTTIEDILDAANVTNFTGVFNNQRTVNFIEDATNRGANILGLIFFSLLFGIGIRRVAKNSEEFDVQYVYRFTVGLRKVMVYLVSIIIWTSPIGICSLVASAIGSTDDIVKQLKVLGLFTLTTSVGFIIHGILCLPVILYIFTKRNPLKFMYHMMQALFCAAGTASSIATLPITQNCLENHVKINRKIMRFMMPMGTTINMDGTALWMSVSAIYLAQYLDIQISSGGIVLVIVISVLTSIATASVPSAGLISLGIVLEAVGVPGKSVGLILAIDWFVDRLRTPVNVFSNAIGCAVMDRFVAVKYNGAIVESEPGVATEHKDGVSIIDMEMVDGTCAYSPAHLYQYPHITQRNRIQKMMTKPFKIFQKMSYKLRNNMREDLNKVVLVKNKPNIPLDDVWALNFGNRVYYPSPTASIRRNRSDSMPKSILFRSID